MSNPMSKDLWTACKLVFVLFHGQNQTEQGFDVNKDMFFENPEETSLIGQRIVFDHMSCSGIEIQDFTSTNDLTFSCKMC